MFVAKTTKAACHSSQALAPDMALLHHLQGLKSPKSYKGAADKGDSVQLIPTCEIQGATGIHLRHMLLASS